jgi:hypothetical protein
MAGANPAMIIKIAANVAALKAALAESTSAITVTTAGMAKLASSLDGSKLEQRAHNIVAAIGGVEGAARLTDAEAKRLLVTLDAWIDKGARVGKEIPPDILKTRDALVRTKDELDLLPQKTKNADGGFKSLAATMGVTFSVGAVIAFGQEILQMGDDIVRVADRTGLLTDEVQRLSYIGGQSGNTLEELTGSIGQMQNRLASGDTSALAAVKGLGVSLDLLKTQSPYQQMETLATEIAKIPNPANQAQVAMDLFGKTGIAILPTLKANFQALGDEAPIMSDKTVQALDKAGDSIARFKLSAKVWAAEAYNYLGKVFDQGVAAVYRYIASLLDSIAGLLGWMAKIPGASRVWPGLAADIKGAGDAAQWFKDAASASAQQSERVTAAVRSAGPPMDVLGKAAKTTGDAHHVAAANMKEVVVIAPEVQHALELMALMHQHQVSALALEASAFKETQKAAEDYIKHLPHASFAIPSVGVDAAPLKTLPGIDVGKPIIPAIAKIHDATVALDALAQSFVMLAQVGGKSFGSIMQGAGSIVVGLSAAAKANKEFGGSAGIASGLFKEGSGASAKWASGVASAGAIASGAMNVWAATANDGSKAAGAFHGAMGGAQAGAAFGPWGMAVGAAAGAVVGMIHTLSAGRRAVKDFAASFDTKALGSGFDELHAKMAGALGDAVSEKFWIQLTQKTKKGNKKAAQAVIDQITEALASAPSALAADAGYQTQAELQAVADKAKATYEYMKSSGLYAAAAIADAFQKSKDAQIGALGETATAQKTAIDEITARYTESIGKLDEEYKSLSTSVAAEAEEAEMGVAETRDRARMAAIDIEKQAQAAMRDAEIAAKQETFDAVLDAGSKVDAALRDIFGKNLKIPYEFVPQNTPGGSPGSDEPREGYVGGTHGEYLDFGAGTAVTLHGRERVMTAAEGRGSSSRGSDLHVTLVMPDGEVLLRQVVKAAHDGGLT